jgi:hypothetical protein
MSDSADLEHDLADQTHLPVSCRGLVADSLRGVPVCRPSRALVPKNLGNVRGLVKIAQRARLRRAYSYMYVVHT